MDYREKARQFVHRLRDQVDALLSASRRCCGRSRLTTRLAAAAEDAARVVVDSRGRLPLEARVINRSSPAPTILATTEQASPDKCALLKERGVEVLLLPEEKGRVDLKALLQALGKREMTSVLVEGGGTLNYAFLERDLVDKLFLFVAPIICGGREAPTPFSGEGVAS